MRVTQVWETVHRQLWNGCLVVSYWYALFVGLMPAPLISGERKFRRSCVYLAYSAAMHALCLATAPLIFPFVFYSTSYMSRRQTLQWTYMLSLTSKVIAFIAIVKATWCGRQRLIDLFHAYAAFLQRYRRFQTGSGNEHQIIVRHVQRLLVSKCICGHVIVLLGFSIFFKDNKKHLSQPSVVVMAFTFLFMNTFLMTATHQLVFALCQLRCQFAFINAALRKMRLELLQSDCRRHVPHTLETRFVALCAMHWDCYRLARRLFRLFETPFAAVLLRTFSTSINVIFQTVLFTSQRIDTNASYNANGYALVLVFFLDSMLIVAIVEGVVGACNATGQVLRDYNDVAHLRGAAGLLRETDIFSTYLSSHQLKYDLCGLFEFNKGLSLRWMLTALVKASVLIQFDMKVE